MIMPKLSKPIDLSLRPFRLLSYHWRPAGHGPLNLMPSRQLRKDKMTRFKHIKGPLISIMFTTSILPRTISIPELLTDPSDPDKCLWFDTVHSLQFSLSTETVTNLVFRFTSISKWLVAIIALHSLLSPLESQYWCLLQGFTKHDGENASTFTHQKTRDKTRLHAGKRF